MESFYLYPNDLKNMPNKRKAFYAHNVHKLFSYTFYDRQVLQTGWIMLLKAVQYKTGFNIGPEVT